MILQKQHDIFNLFLLLPALFNLPDPLLADSFYFLQTGDLAFDHIQCLRAKQSYDPFGKFRSNTLDQTRSQIFFNSIYSCRECLLPSLSHKLPAILTVHLPVAIDQQDRSYIYIQKTSDDRHQILMILDRTFQNCVTVLRILVSDPLNHTTKCHRGVRGLR